MEPISRRRALQLGGLGLASTVIGGIGLARGVTSRFDPATGAALAEPPALRSTDGELQVRLEAAEGRVTRTAWSTRSGRVAHADHRAGR